MLPQLHVPTVIIAYKKKSPQFIEKGSGNLGTSGEMGQIRFTSLALQNIAAIHQPCKAQI